MGCRKGCRKQVFFDASEGKLFKLAFPRGAEAKLRLASNAVSKLDKKPIEFSTKRFFDPISRLSQNGHYSTSKPLWGCRKGCRKLSFGKGPERYPGDHVYSSILPQNHRHGESKSLEARRGQ